MLATGFPVLGLSSQVRPPAIGRVFYVRHFVGNNANNGTDPGTPFQTITYALTQCVADRNDYIFVLDCWNDEPAFPIDVNVQRVHIIGLTVPSMNVFPQLQGGGADILSLNAAYIEIAGLGFLSIGASGIVSGAAPPNFCWIHHCTFATAAASLLNGIQCGLVGMLGNTLIEDCAFGSSAAAQITVDGITGDLNNCIIRNNIFRNCQNVAINLAINAIEIGAIYGNYFFLPLGVGAAGWGITMQAGTFGGIIANNVGSQTGDATGGANPFRDISAPGAINVKLHGWSNNYWGVTPQIPAVV